MDMRREYFDRFGSKNSSILRKNKLAKLKIEILNGENGTDKIYKYCGIESAEKILSNQSLLLRPPDNFNDPFDCAAQVGVWNDKTKFGPSAEEIEFVRTVLSTLPQKYNPTTFKLHNDLRFSYGFQITCFSSNYKNHLMWSHYSQSHRGVCLEYSIADLQDDIHPCLYTEDLSEFNFSSPEQRLALIKKSDWKYESEWRLLKKSIRPKIRLLSQALNQIYIAVHSNEAFNRFDHEEWSNINTEIMSGLKQQYQQESQFTVKPTRLILGAAFTRNTANETVTRNWKYLIALARKLKIPVVQLISNQSSFEFLEREVTEEKPTWLSLVPDLRDSLPENIQDET